MSILRDLRIGLNGSNGATIRLIIINCIVFICANIAVNVVDMKIDNSREAYFRVSEYTDLPAKPSEILPHFWTLFSYMFVHYGLLHLFSNMLWLYFLGRIFSDQLGGARLTGVYIIGGIAGGIVFLLASNLIPHKGFAQLEGASAGVMAVVVAIAAFSPDTTVFPFGMAMKLKWLALISFLLTTIIDLSSNTGGKASHIGGAAFGLLYGMQMRGRKKFLEGFMSVFRFPKTKLKVAHTRSQKGSDELYNVNKTTIRKRVDEILDKISRSGYDSLTREEKDFLQNNHDKF